MNEAPLKLPDAIAGIVEMNQRMGEVFRPFADIHRHLANAMLPIAKNLEGLALSSPPWLQQLEGMTRQYIEVQNQISRTLQIIAARLAPALHSIDEFIKNIAILEWQSRLLKDAGFLPHVTMPMNLIEQCADDPNELSNSIEKYYRDNWPEIHHKLMERVDAHLIDDEAKAVFREALTAHQLGHFRSVIRLLFPEIERVARTELNEGTLKNVLGAKGLKPERVLQQLAGELSIADVAPQGYFGLALFQRLTDHLYVSVWTDDDYKRMKADTVPNRHAALHGRIIYRSFKNSLNTLFMTDYIFQIVDVIKNSTAETADEKTTANGRSENDQKQIGAKYNG